MASSTTGNIAATGSDSAITLTVSKPDTTVQINVYGTFTTAAVKVEGKDNAGNWYPLACLDAGTLIIYPGGTAITLTDSTAKSMTAIVGQFVAVRVYASALATGDIDVTMYGDNVGAMLPITANLNNDTFTVLTADTTLSDGVDLILNTTTGTKIGTATSQKLGFWNVTPVIQPSGTGELIGFTGNGATNANAVNFAANGNSGTASYTLGDVVKALKAVGVLAAS